MYYTVHIKWWCCTLNTHESVLTVVMARCYYACATGCLRGKNIHIKHHKGALHFILWHVSVHWEALRYIRSLEGTLFYFLTHICTLVGAISYFPATAYSAPHHVFVSGKSLHPKIHFITFLICCTKSKWWQDAFKCFPTQTGSASWRLHL